MNLRNIFLLPAKPGKVPAPLILLLQQPVELVPEGRRHFGGTCRRRTERGHLTEVMPARLFSLRRLLVEKLGYVPKFEFLLRLGGLLAGPRLGGRLLFFLLLFLIEQLRQLIRLEFWRGLFGRLDGLRLGRFRRGCFLGFVDRRFRRRRQGLRDLFGSRSRLRGFL